MTTDSLKIAGALATFVLTVAMWFVSPVTLRADCWDDGENIGMFCRDQFPMFCSQCVDAKCTQEFGSGACYIECVQGGVSSKHFNETFDRLRMDFIEPGLISYAFMHLPLESIHPRAMDAARATECAREQGRFWSVHDRLFQIAGGGELTRESIRAVVIGQNVDAPKFDACMENVAARILHDRSEAARLEIRSTPVFLLGTSIDDDRVAIRTRINGAQPAEVFANAIRKVLNL